LFFFLDAYSRSWFPARRIHVSVFKNETNEYAVEERLTHSMIDAFRRDGRLRVVPAKNADLELKGRITKITLLPTVYTNLDRAIGYTMNIVIIVDVIDNSSDEPILKDRSFSATGSFLLSSELSQARTQDATDSLSEAVLSQLLEGW